MIVIANFIKAILLLIRSWFFPFIPKQSYLYLACGGLNLFFDMTVFFVAYHLLFAAHNFVTPFFTFSPHIASLFLAFFCTTPTGFFMSRYIVWTNSQVRGKKQMINYIGVVLVCVVLNTGLLKLFIDVLYFYPLPARLLTSVIVIIISYILQRYYTFKVHKAIESYK